MATPTILAIGAYVPPAVLTNDDLSQRLDTSDEWIRTRTGIRQRHVAGADETTATLSHAAAQAALEAAGMPATAVDWILVATDTAEMWSPATACFVQALLGAERASAIDLTGGCAGFLQALTLAEGLVARGHTVLLIGTEVLTKAVDWSDRSTAVLFGDGSGALLMAPDGAGIYPRTAFSQSDGRQADILNKPYGGTRHPLTPELVAGGHHHTIHMEGRKVFRHAVHHMSEAARQVLAMAGLEADDIAWVVPHQANQRILDAVARELAIPPAKVFSHVAYYANTGSASVVLALADMLAQNLIRPGDRLLSVAFGSGFSWAAQLLEVGSLPPARFLNRDR
ncbi:MAG: ketoacyl-ACP synthase III [Firmicutes bacterium]|nr:ketoacyl-ACP synthase III [Alicyclobacillaceae bacterium]MCL6496196.1 ketoacyl-ACP synthase III [Bacillota bacterium]